MSRFTASSSAVAPLQERIAGAAPPPANKQHFGRSSTGFGRSQTGMSALDRSATLKKLEALRAVATHAQEAELAHVVRTWAEVARLPAAQRQPAARSPPRSPMAFVTSSRFACHSPIAATVAIALLACMWCLSSSL